MELINGKTLKKADGSNVQADAALAGKAVVCLYFSAHWCPPCRAFTPVLKDFYEVCARIVVDQSSIVFPMQL
jgi:nucleoredoxin